ncbi:MAG: hypothetical protein BWY80_00422 [Firmicutes bacterium ADurb.Bin456]|nr:MAG: hypothetical protein BWY80_00422 [Firmicutes bacterium ADurb.Bin456]
MLLKTRGPVLAALLLISLGALFMPGRSNAQEIVPNVTQEMLAPDFWINKLPDPDSLLMERETIESFNRDILRTLPDLVYDLTSYPATLGRNQLIKLIKQRTFPEEDRYSKGVKVGQAYYEGLLLQMNLPGIEEQNSITPALTVRRTNIRTFPTADESLEEPEDHDFDLFQETAISPAEPVLILHRSLDNQWYFVQTYNYNGWMPAADLAVAGNRQIWLDYVQPGNYLVITGNRLKLGHGPYPGMELTMGVKVPLRMDGAASGRTYTIELPARGNEGELVIETALVPAGEGVSVGYLPYTRANIIRQAFKILGEPYGWGGLSNGRDCSAFVQDVYKSFGFMLPRNSDEQERSAGVTVKFTGADRNQRLVLLDSLEPGASLHTPTHELLYLGRHEGLYYAIHDVTSVGDPVHPNPDGSPGRLTLNKVVVSDLSLPRRNGQQFVDALTSAKQLDYGSKSLEPGRDYDVEVYVNGSPVSFPGQGSYLDKSACRVFVPVRTISEALGAYVDWLAEEQKVVVRKGENVITFTIGQKYFSEGGRDYPLEASAVIVNSRTMVPLRFISEALGAGVVWKQEGNGGVVDISL